MLRSVNNFNENKFVKRNYIYRRGIVDVINGAILPNEVTVSVPDYVSTSSLLCRIYLRNQTLDTYIHTKLEANFDKDNPNHWFLVRSGYVYGIVFKFTDKYSLDNIHKLIDNTPDDSLDKINRCLFLTPISRGQLDLNVSTFSSVINEKGEYCISMGSKRTETVILNVDTWTWSFGDYFILPDINSVEKKLHSFYLLNNIISSPLYKYNKGGVIIC